MSRLLHTQVDLELLNSIDMDMKWNVRKKGRTHITRRPRTEDFEFSNGIQDPASFQTKKFGAENIAVDTSSKKRRSKHQSPSSAGPKTPSLHNEEFGQRGRSNSLSQSQKTKSRTRSRNNNVLKSKKNEVFDLNDFSGIELLAAAACSSLIHDKADHVEEHAIIPRVNLCDDKLDASAVQDSIIRDAQNPLDDVKEKEEEDSAPSKGLRLHWDLNTVMDEWVEPCDDLMIEPHSEEKCSVNLNLKAVTSKTSDGESSVTVCKSDGVDSLIHPGKCEELTTSTTSVLREQTFVKVELDKISKLDHHQQPVSEEVIQGVCQSPNLCTSDFDNKVTPEHFNVTEVGYDSPFEDGEFREPIESDNISKDDSAATIENPLSEKVEASSGNGQTPESQSSLLVKETRTPNNDMEQDSQADMNQRPRIDESGKDGHDESRPVGESTSLDLCKNGACERQSRSSTTGDYSTCRFGRGLGVDKYMGRDKDSSMRVWELKRCNECPRPKNVTRNYDLKDRYRRDNRRSSPSERNNDYGSNRGPPVRNRDRDRGGFGFHPKDYHDSKTRYIERKPRSFPNSNRPSTRSRSRSRSGSPIAWNFQKRKNLDSKSDSGEVERSSKCSNDQFRDKRQSPLTISQLNQRLDPPERLKSLSDDRFRFTQRPAARFTQMTSHSYKDNNSDGFGKHNDNYKKVLRVGHPTDDASGVRRFRYPVEHRDLNNNLSRDTRNNNHTPVVISENKS